MPKTPTPRRRKARDLDAVRDRLSTLLPPLLENAAASYQTFASLQPPDDAKGFTAHHSACKAALAHLDLLAKLARWAEGKEEAPPAAEPDATDRLLAEAQAALAEYADMEDGDTDDPT